MSLSRSPSPRGPLLPVGLLLVALGIGNWYTGRDKALEHEQMLAAAKLAAPVEHFEDFGHLTARTTGTLLSSLQRGDDEYTIVTAKLDFYRVVQSGGRLMIFLGLFCAAAGFIRAWQQQRPARQP